MSQNPAVPSVVPATHRPPPPRPGLPRGRQSSCVKIPKLERTSRGTKFRASDPHTEPAQSPAALLPTSERPGCPRAPPMARLCREARRARGSSARGARGLSRSPAARRRLPLAKSQVGAEATGCVAQFSRLPSSQEPQEGRAGGRPYPVGPVCCGGATSVSYRPMAERSSSRAQAGVQAVTGAPDKRPLHRFATSVPKLFAQLGRPWLP